MADQSLIEKRKTAQNQRSEILEARVIANYGDPGLDEDYHFDILSRYVVVMIESCLRVPTRDRYTNMFAIVKRPKHLWIDATSTPDGNPAGQQRVDKKGNSSTGLAGSFSSNGIARIYPSYSLGELIRIRELSQPEQAPGEFFLSAFNVWDTNTNSYGSWHTDGGSLSYFSSESMRTQLRMKTISPLSANGFYYQGFLNKMQYEAFALSLNQGNSSLYNGMTSIFNGSWNGNQAVYSAHGGYLFSSAQSILLNAVSYEDININNKDRVTSSDCIPLIVATPNTFPNPSSRSVGTIIYNPTYSPVSH
jgi:hypothetical protein